MTSPELEVLVDFVFPWGIEYPVVFLPQGLFTFANGLVLKDLAKLRDFHFSRIFRRLLTYCMRDGIESCRCCLLF